MGIITTIILVGLTTLLVISFYRNICDRIAIADFKRKNGCREPTKYPHKEPILGLDLFFTMGKAMKSGKMLEISLKLFQTYGRTFQVNSLGATTLNTCEPKNIQTILSLSFKSFGMVPVKAEKPASSPMGQGILTADGEVWARSRALIRPTFAKTEISNFAALETHVSTFLELVARDGSTVDLQPLIKHLFLDISTEFIFGESVESQSPDTPFDSKQFMYAFEAAMRGLAARMQLGKFVFLRGRDKEWKTAVTNVHAFLDRHVARAIKTQQNLDLKKPQDEKIDYPQKRYILVDEMAKLTQEPVDLRYQLLHVFFPAQNAPGVALSDILFHLARDQIRWDKLRAEVMTATQSQPITFELLKSIKYMRYVFHESLRLHPSAGHLRRICHEDTVLPLGGGPNGKAPILVRKGTNIVINVHALHRDKEIWGNDANEFNPERWENVRPIWEYLPFSGGPRVCPAQNMVYTDTAYIIVRLLQEFDVLQNQDPRPWTENFRMIVENMNGVKVKMNASWKS